MTRTASVRGRAHEEQVPDVGSVSTGTISDRPLARWASAGHQLLQRRPDGGPRDAEHGGSIVSVRLEPVPAAAEDELAHLGHQGVRVLVVCKAVTPREYSGQTIAYDCHTVLRCHVTRSSRPRPAPPPAHCYGHARPRRRAVDTGDRIAAGGIRLPSEPRAAGCGERSALKGSASGRSAAASRWGGCIAGFSWPTSGPRQRGRGREHGGRDRALARLHRTLDRVGNRRSPALDAAGHGVAVGGLVCWPWPRRDVSLPDWTFRLAAAFFSLQAISIQG